MYELFNDKFREYFNYSNEELQNVEVKTHQVHRVYVHTWGTYGLLIVPF